MRSLGRLAKLKRENMESANKRRLGEGWMKRENMMSANKRRLGEGWSETEIDEEWQSLSEYGEALYEIFTVVGKDRGFSASAYLSDEKELGDYNNTLDNHVDISIEPASDDKPRLVVTFIGELGWRENMRKVYHEHILVKFRELDSELVDEKTHADDVTQIKFHLEYD